LLALSASLSVALRCMAAPRVGNLIWIAWCFTVSLFRDASPDVDGLMFDRVAAVWVALSSAVWLSRLAASEWMTCFLCRDAVLAS
jgi:hypothetical protein